MKKVVYVGVFLTMESQWKLLEKCFPLHTNVYCDHVTIKFQPKPEELDQFALGKEVRFTVDSVACDDNGQAARVVGIAADNKFPHITISTANGVKPVYSNKLCETVLAVYFDEPLELIGIIDTFPRS